MLDHRKIRLQNSWSSQVLVQWSGLPLEETSWEDLISFRQLYPDFHVEDKVSFGGEGNDMILEENGGSQQKPTRMKGAPRQLVDFISHK